MSDSDQSGSDADVSDVEALEVRGGYFGELARQGIICAKEARSYGLSDRDLSSLKCTRARNPFHRGAAPLRLYERTDVLDLANKKQELKQYNLDHAEEFAAAKKLAEKQKAAQVLSTLQRHSESAASKKRSAGNSRLSSDMWGLILEQLVQDCTVDGLRGPSVVVRDFANAAEAVPEAREAMPDALKALAKHLSPAACHSIASPAAVYAVAAHFEASPAPLVPDDFEWKDRVVADPMSMKLTELKDVARSLGVKMTGTKAVLIMRLLNAFGVEHPVNVPAKVLWYIAAEKSRTASFELRRSAEVLGLLAAQPAGQQTVHGSWFRIRRLLAGRYETEAALQHDTAAAIRLAAERAAAETEKQMRKRAKRQAKLLEMKKQRQAQARAEQQRLYALQNAQMLQASAAAATQPAIGSAGCMGMQACNQTPAPTCSLHMCGTCCKRVRTATAQVCARHH